MPYSKSQLNLPFFKKVAMGLFFALGACSPTPLTPFAAKSVDAGIVNGQVVTSVSGISSRIVYVYGRDGSGVYNCTGSLLPGNIVLTAAHCVAPGSLEMRVTFGLHIDSFDDPMGILSYRKVIARRHNPLHDQKNHFTQLANDVGMVKFEGPVPSGYQSFAAPTSENFTTPAHASDRLYMIGYGITDADRNDDGTLRSTTLSDSATGSLAGSRNKSIIVLNQSATGICDGDSGGPLVVFRGEMPTILGLASGVAPLVGGNSVASRDRCKGISVFTRMDNQLAWIRSTYTELLKPSAK